MMASQMGIVEDLPAAGLSADADYEMKFPGPTQATLPQDDAMEEAGIVSGETMDGLMVDGYDIQPSAFADPMSTDVDVAFGEEAQEPSNDSVGYGTMIVETHFPEESDAQTGGPVAAPQSDASDAVVDHGQISQGLVADATARSEEVPAAATEDGAAEAAVERHSPAEAFEDQEEASSERRPGAGGVNENDRTAAQEEDELAEASHANANGQIDAAKEHGGKADGDGVHVQGQDPEVAEEDQLEHSLHSEDSTAPPTVRVSFNGQDFVLFSHDEPTSYLGGKEEDTGPDRGDSGGFTIKVPAPRLKVADDVFWQPLESIFASLRVPECLGEFLEEATELAVHMPDLDLTVQEDNVYCRDITLDDLFQLHQGLGYSTSLHLLVTETQRFISKYNALAQHVAGLIEDTQDKDADNEPELEHLDQDSSAVTRATADVVGDETHEVDELETGEAERCAAAQAVHEIVSAENAEAEDDSHETHEDQLQPDGAEDGAAKVLSSGRDVPVKSAASGSAEHAEPGAAASDETGNDGGSSLEAAANRDADVEAASGSAVRERNSELGSAEAGLFTEADDKQEGAGQPISSGDAEEDEVDEIDEGGGVEAVASGEEVSNDAAYADQEEYEDEGGEEDGWEGEEDEEADRASRRGDGEGDDDDVEAYEEDEADGSITIEGSEDAAEASHVEGDHKVSGEDEIVEYEEYEEDQNGSVGVVPAEVGEHVYEEDPVSTLSAASPTKRSLTNDEEADELSNTDLKRARVDQDA